MGEKTYATGWGFLWKLFFLVLLAWVLFLSRDIVAALLVAIVLSSAFNPAVSFLERKKFPRIVGTLLIYLAAAILIGFVLYTFVPIALSEVSSLLALSQKFVTSTPGSGSLTGIFEHLSSILSKVNDFFSTDNVSLIQITSRFLGGVFIAFTIFALSFYLTIGRDGVERFLVAVLPAAYEKKALSVYERVRAKIGRWLAGQFFISLVVGVVAFVGLKLLGMRYSLSLGFLAGLAELVPYAGPIFTGGLAIIIALGQSTTLAVYVFILFLVIQQLENHLLQPLVARYTTALNAVVVLSALLVGGRVFGVVGIVLAVPVAVLAQEILEEWAEAKQLERSRTIRD